MCLALPLRVVALHGDCADVRNGDRTLVISRAALPELAAGDWVIVLGGLAVRRIDIEAAEALTAAIRGTTSERTSP